MKNLILTLSIALSLSFLAACGHSDSEYQAVYDKIEQNQELTAADYDLILDYIDDMVEAASKAKTMKDLKKVEKEYKYGTTFISELQYGRPSEEVLSKIEKKAEKIYNQYQKAQKDLMKRLTDADDDDDDDYDDNDDDSDDDDDDED